MLVDDHFCSAIEIKNAKSSLLSAWKHSQQIPRNVSTQNQVLWKIRNKAIFLNNQQYYLYLTECQIKKKLPSRVPSEWYIGEYVAQEQNAARERRRRERKKEKTVSSLSYPESRKSTMFMCAAWTLAIFKTWKWRYAIFNNGNNNNIGIAGKHQNSHPLLRSGCVFFFSFFF